MAVFFFTWTLPLSVYGWCWYYTTALSMSMASEVDAASSSSSASSSSVPSSIALTRAHEESEAFSAMSILRHKTLLLALVLALVVVNRSRIFGVVISKLLSLKMARDGKLQVSVKHILLRRLVLLNVEITSSADPKCRLLLTKVAIHSHLMAFFRSFGQKKILLIEIDELRLQIDELRPDKVFERKRPRDPRPETPQKTATSEPQPQQHHQQQPGQPANNQHNTSNMLGFLRFVDILFNRIQVETQFVGAQMRCECHNLSFGILDVLVNKNLLHFQVNSSLVRVQITTSHQWITNASAPSGSNDDGTNEFIDKSEDTSREIISEGLLWEIPKLCAILDVLLKHKRPQEVLACKMFGSMEEMAHLQVCSSFLEFVIDKGEELMHRGFFTGLLYNDTSAQRKRHSSACSSTVLPSEMPLCLPSSSPTEFVSLSPTLQPHAPKKNMSMELADFRFRFILLIENETIHVPFQLTAELLKWSLTTKGNDDSENGTTSSEASAMTMVGNQPLGTTNESAQVNESPGSLLVHGVIHNMVSHVGSDSHQQFFTVSSIELRAVKRLAPPNELDLQTGEIVVTLNPRMLQVLSSLDLITTNLRLAVERWEKAALSPMPPDAGDESAARARPKHENKWHIRLRSISWRSRICLISSEPTCKEQLTVYGLNSQVHATFINGNNTKTHVEVSQLSADVMLPISKEKTSFLFFHVEISMGKRYAVMAKEFFFRMKFKSCSVNSFENDSFAPRKRLPAARFTGVDIESVEMISTEDGNTVNDINVSIVDTDVQWSHQEHRSMIAETIAVVTFLDRVRIRLTPASKDSSSKGSHPRHDQPPGPADATLRPGEQLNKKSDLCIRSKNASVRIEDIQDVSSSALVTLTDGKLQFQKQPHTEVNQVTASFIRIHLKEFLQPFVEISSFAFVQKTICGPHRRFAKVPVHMDVSMLEAHVDLRPKCRLLLFCLQMQELLIFEPPSSKDASTKRGTGTVPMTCSGGASNLGSLPDMSKALESLAHLSDTMTTLDDFRHGEHEIKKLANLKGITLACTSLWLQVSEKEDENAVSGGNSPGSPRGRRISVPTAAHTNPNDDDPDPTRKNSVAIVSYLLEMNKLTLKATLSKTFELSEGLFQFLQHIKRDEAAFFFPQSIEHVLGVEGTLSVDSMLVTRQATAFATFSRVDMRFSVTDILRNDLIRPPMDDALLAASTASPFMRCVFPAHMNIYEISVSGESADILAEHHLLQGAVQLLPIVQDALDTTIRGPGRHASSSNSNDPGNCTSWRFRQLGNLELSVETLNVSIPMQQKLGKPPTWSCPEMSGYNKVLVFELKRASMMQRQYQKVSMDYFRMKCQLDDFDEKKTARPILVDIGEVTEVSEETSDGLSNTMLLVSFPHTQLDVVIDWKEDCALQNPPGGEAYAITLYLTLQSTVQTPRTPKSPAKVLLSDFLQLPSLEDAFVCLNWDWIYPFLVSLTLANSTPSDPGTTSSAPPSAASSSASSSRSLYCTGIQWHVNLDFFQIAWWDGGSFEAALLFVVRDFLVHGFMKKVVPVEKARPSKKGPSGSLNAIREQDELLEPEWVTPEMTLYLDGLRAYLLPDELDFSSVSAFQVAQSCRIGVIPFQFCDTEDFFIELLGISYRFVYAPPLDPAAGTSVFSVKDLAMEISESPLVWMEKIHESFLPVTCNFSISSSFFRASSVFIPDTFTVAPKSSPSKTPPVITHAQKKLLKLKRRPSEDGTCPIQIDAMRLLWTIGTRNSIAYMCFVTLEDMQSLADMRAAVAKSNSMLRSQASMTSVTSGSSVASLTNAAVDAAQAGGLSESLSISLEPSRAARRPSQRDTLLELLNQGKLGKKKGGSPKKSDASKDMSSPGRHRRGHNDGDDSEGTDTRVIHFKRYTFDVHDAQINLHDDNSKSNVLVVSRHFHLEVGRDALNTTNIVQMALDDVSIHVAPIDVDVSVGVLWYTDQTRKHTTNPTDRFATFTTAPGGSSGSSSSSTTTTTTTTTTTAGASGSGSGSLLKQVMEECRLTCVYTHAIASDSIEVESELSFMNLSTDRHQFFQLLNIVRHVILSPPPSFLKRSKRAKNRVAPTGSSESHDQNSSSKQDMTRSPSKDDLQREPSEVRNHKGSLVDGENTAALYANNPKKLHAMLMEKMQTREAKMANTYRANTPLAIQSLSFKAIGCKWRFRTSPETTSADHEFVEFRIQNLSGCHIFYEDKCTKLTMNIQWMEINNLRPGASSIAFEDAMAVLKPQLLFARHGLQLKGPSGLELQEFLNLNHMLSIRAESGPVTKVLGQKLRVLDVLEISIFPEVPYMIVIQLAIDFYELMYKFFFEQTATPSAQTGGTEPSENAEQVLFGRKASVLSSSPPKSPKKNALTIGNPSGVNANNTSNNAMVLSTSSRPLVHERTRRRSLSLAPTMTRFTSKSRSGGSGGSGAGNTSSAGADGSNAGEEEDSSAQEGEELFYFKYVRIGNIRLRINCNGFFVNLSNFDLDLPSYVCQSKLCTWKKLLGKFESHLKWYVTKESASSGLSQFKNKFLKWQAPGLSLSASTLGPSALVSTQSPFVAGNDDDKNESQQQEDNFAKAKMLFGPYHMVEDTKKHNKT